MLISLAILIVIILGTVSLLAAKWSELGSKVEDLSRDVSRLERRLSALEEAEPAPTAAIPVTHEVREPAISQPTEMVRPTPQAVPVAPAAELAAQPSLPSFAPPAAPSRTREEWEALIGGKLLNRIGALALIIGVGFFLKYAFDKNWITEWMRVVIGVLTGAATLLLAARSHRKGLEIFAQGLVGAGIAILYLSVYASFNFYSLVSQPVAFVLMACVTAIAFAQAFRYDSLAVSLLAWIGGFLTPFLLSTGEAKPVGLFTYLALLDVAILALLVVKDRWIILLPLTLVGTYVMYYLWYASGYQAGDVWTSVAFLTIFWVLFHLLEIAWCITKRTAFRISRRWGSAANAAAYYIGLYAVLDQDRHDWLAPATLLVAIVYALSAMVIHRKAAEDRLPVVQNAITGILLMVVATQIQFEAYTAAMFYALEAVLLAWVGRRWKLDYVWYAASAVLLWGALVLLVEPGALYAIDPSSFTLILTPRVAGYLSLILAVALVLWMARAFQTRKGENICAALHVGWILLGFILLTVECVDYFRWLETTSATSTMLKLNFLRSMALATLWILFSLPLVIVGIRKSEDAVSIPGYVIAGLAWLVAAAKGFSFFPIEELQTVLNIRFGVLLLVGLVFALHARTTAADTASNRRMSTVFHFVWIALFFILCTAETVDFFRQRALMGGSMEEIAFMQFMTLGGVWTIYAVVLGWIGLRVQIMPMISASLWVMLLAAIIAGVRGVAYDPVQAYSPILNLRVVIMLTVIGGLNWFLHTMREGTVSMDWLGEVRSAMRVLTIVLALVLITGEIRDFFEKAIETSIAGSGSEDTAREMENLKQLLLSSSWLIYSILLMVYGIWRRARLLRIISIGLFGIAILKIFVYDLSFLDTLYRIFSFLGLGVILLGVSYLYQRYRDEIFGKGVREAG